MKYSHSQYFSAKLGSVPHLKNRDHFVARPAFGSSSEGFTLIEVLVVGAIIAFLSTTLILNFSRTKINIEQGANLVMATIREAQSKTVSSTVYNGYNPCGYGIHYISSTQFIIYVGPNAATASPNCTTMDKRYNSTRDSILLTQTFTDLRTEIKSSFNDIFFLPPDPKTYLNNNASLSGSPINIQIGIIGTACPQDCRTISVYPSGKIESQ